MNDDASDVWIFPRNGVDLKFNTKDFYSKKWFYPRYDSGKFHEPGSVELFIDHLKEDSIVFDIGSHIGYFSCLASKLAPKGKVFSFEIDPICVKLIERNKALNNSVNLEVIHAAIVDLNTEVKVPKVMAPTPGLSLNKVSGMGTFHLNGKSVDSLINELGFSPDFVKLDIEGAEGLALKGMSEWLKKKDVKLLLELHVDKLKIDFDTDFKTIIKLLIDNGFTIMKVDHRKQKFESHQVNLETSLAGNLMLFCSKS